MSDTPSNRRPRLKRFYFGTNFKMHQTPEETRQFVLDLSAALDVGDAAQLFIIPPHTSLYRLPELADPANIWIGAQNMHWADEGAFTGEISPRMLRAIGVKLIMLGHAERRQVFGETDVALHKKVEAAGRFGLRTLLCVGETAEEKRYGIAREVVARQMKVALHGFDPAGLQRLMIAYEPVWSIGEGGIPATVPDVVYTVEQIRATLIELFGAAGDRVPVLYGGSVNRENCGPYAAIDMIDGVFVGRAAWKVGGFVEVFKTAYEAWLGSSRPAADAD